MRRIGPVFRSVVLLAVVLLLCQQLPIVPLLHRVTGPCDEPPCPCVRYCMCANDRRGQDADRPTEPTESPSDRTYLSACSDPPATPGLMRLVLEPMLTARPPLPRPVGAVRSMNPSSVEIPSLLLVREPLRPPRARV